MYFLDDGMIVVRLRKSELECLRICLVNDTTIFNNRTHATAGTIRHWDKMLNHRHGMIARIEEKLMELDHPQNQAQQGPEGG